MRFDVQLTVRPRDGVRDPQGEAVQEALHRIGYSEARVHSVGRTLRMALRGDSEQAVRTQVESMCRELLVNPNLETYELQIGVAA
jgi:phosphoribosylformylglycinamidine synthase